MATATHFFSVLILIISGKGGGGKSLTALLLADLFELAGIVLRIFQLDDQQRLEKSIGREVKPIDIALLRKARKDPGVLVSAFSDFYASVESMAIDQRSILLDIGATQQHAFLEYAALTELNDDLVDFGVSTLAFVPLVAEPESIIQAARQVEALAKILPSARPCLILNQRDGIFSSLGRESAAAQLFSERIQPLLSSGMATITMPKIEAGSWAHFERQHQRFIDVVGYDIPTTMRVSGLSRPEARLARGDVAAWFATMESEITKVLPVLSVGDSHE
jgi:hypothetical protein